MELIQRPKLSFAWFLLTALCLHILIVRFAPSGALLKKLSKLQDTIPVELSDDKRSVVITEESNEDFDGKANHLGEFKNRAKEETQSARRGRFQSGGAFLREKLLTEGEGENAGPPDLSDLLALAQSPNHIDEMKQGNQTLLNTDPVLYASYINRIAMEIYEPWVDHASQAAERMHVSGKKLETTLYVTKVVVVMDRDGRLASLQILKSSGIPELDEAPKHAFWDAEPFPNPPSQMLEKDGLARFVYEFHFEWKSSGFNIVPLI